MTPFSDSDRRKWASKILRDRPTVANYKIKMAETLEEVNVGSIADAVYEQLMLVLQGNCV